MKGNNTAYIPAVDHLRALAAIWIVPYHGLYLVGQRISPPGTVQTAHTSGLNNPLYSLWAEGHTAVALFMTLSGFIFTVGTYGLDIQYWQFIRNRVLRIYPLFLVLLFCSELTRLDKLDWPRLATTILPLSDLSLNGDSPFGLGWAVAVEFQFYLIFPLLLRLFNVSVIRTVLCTIAGALAARVMLVYAGLEPRDLSYFHLVGRIDQFVLGMAGAVTWRWLRQNNIRLPLHFPISLVSIVLLIWCFHDVGGGFDSSANWKLLWPTAEGLAWATFIVGYLAIAHRTPQLISSLLCFIGEMSFSIYLIHSTMFAVVSAMGGVLQPTGRWDLDALATTMGYVLPATLALSAVTYRVIEKPFLRLRRPYLVQDNAAPPNPPPPAPPRAQPSAPALVAARPGTNPGL